MEKRQHALYLLPFSNALTISLCLFFLYFFSNSPAFGATTSAFGARAPSTGLFGAPSPALFGQQPDPAAPGLFGSSSQQQATTGTGTSGAQYQVTTKQDGLGTGTMSLQSISAMPQFENKSHEELRYEDYMQGNKGISTPQSSSVSGGFGANPAPAPLFGASPAPAFGLFGSGSSRAHALPDAQETGSHWGRCQSIPQRNNDRPNRGAARRQNDTGGADALDPLRLAYTTGAAAPDSNRQEDYRRPKRSVMHTVVFLFMYASMTAMCIGGVSHIFRNILTGVPAFSIRVDSGVVLTDETLTNTIEDADDKADYLTTTTRSPGAANFPDPSLPEPSTTGEDDNAPTSVDQPTIFESPLDKSPNPLVQVEYGDNGSFGEASQDRAENHSYHQGDGDGDSRSFSDEGDGPRTQKLERLRVSPTKQGATRRSFLSPIKEGSLINLYLDDDGGLEALVQADGFVVIAGALQQRYPFVRNEASLTMMLLLEEHEMAHADAEAETLGIDAVVVEEMKA